VTRYRREEALFFPVPPQVQQGSSPDPHKPGTTSRRLLYETFRSTPPALLTGELRKKMFSIEIRPARIQPAIRNILLIDIFEFPVFCTAALTCRVNSSLRAPRTGAVPCYTVQLA